MNKVKVNRTELLAILRGNREKHKSEFDDAYDGWMNKVEEAFEAALEDIQAGIYDNLNPANGLPKPTHHLKDYDLAIRMLEMSVDDEIQIEQYDFNQYVMDEWDWKAKFSMTNSSYLG